jgi:hypothetical protein
VKKETGWLRSAFGVPSFWLRFGIERGSTLIFADQQKAMWTNDVYSGLGSRGVRSESEDAA